MNEEKIAEALEKHEESIANLTKSLVESSEKIAELEEKVAEAQVPQGMSQADKDAIDGLLSKIQTVEEEVDGLDATFDVEAENRRKQLLTLQDKVDLLFQTLDEHRHTQSGSAVLGSSEANRLIDAEVAKATKRRGELPAPEIIEGKTTRKGYRYLNNLDLSIK